MDFGKKRIGNFTLLKYNKNGAPYIKVSTLAEDWALEFGFTHSFYALIDGFDVNDDKNLLSNLIVAHFAATSITDPLFIRKIYDCVNEYVREHIDNKESSEEKDEEDLKTVQDFTELAEMADELEQNEVENGLHEPEKERT